MKVKIEMDVDYVKVIANALLEVGKTSPIGLLLNPILSILKAAIQSAEETNNDTAS